MVKVLDSVVSAVTDPQKFKGIKRFAEAPGVEYERLTAKKRAPVIADMLIGLKRGEITLDDLEFDVAETSEGVMGIDIYLAAAIHAMTEGIPISEMPTHRMEKLMSFSYEKAANVIHDLKHEDYSIMFKSYMTFDGPAQMAMLAENLAEVLPERGMSVEEVLQPSARSQQVSNTPPTPVEPYAAAPSWQERIQAARSAPEAGIQR